MDEAYLGDVVGVLEPDVEGLFAEVGGIAACPREGEVLGGLRRSGGVYRERGRSAGGHLDGGSAQRVDGHLGRRVGSGCGLHQVEGLRGFVPLACIGGHEGVDGLHHRGDVRAAHLQGHCRAAAGVGEHDVARGELLRAVDDGERERGVSLDGRGAGFGGRGHLQPRRGGGGDVFACIAVSLHRQLEGVVLCHVDGHFAVGCVQRGRTGGLGGEDEVGDDVGHEAHVDTELLGDVALVGKLNQFGLLGQCEFVGTCPAQLVVLAIEVGHEEAGRDACGECELASAQRIDGKYALGYLSAFLLHEVEGVVRLLPLVHVGGGHGFAAAHHGGQVAGFHLDGEVGAATGVFQHDVALGKAGLLVVDAELNQGGLLRRHGTGGGRFGVEPFGLAQHGDAGGVAVGFHREREVVARSDVRSDGLRIVVERGLRAVGRPLLGDGEVGDDVGHELHVDDAGLGEFVGVLERDVEGLFGEVGGTVACPREGEVLGSFRRSGGVYRERGRFAGGHLNGGSAQRVEGHLGRRVVSGCGLHQVEGLRGFVPLACIGGHEGVDGLHHRGDVRAAHLQGHGRASAGVGEHDVTVGELLRAIDEGECERGASLDGRGAAVGGHGHLEPRRGGGGDVLACAGVGLHG